MKLRQMADALAGRGGLRAIHIIAHGAPGEIGFTAGLGVDLSRIGLDTQSNAQLSLGSTANLAHLDFKLGAELNVGSLLSLSQDVGITAIGSTAAGGVSASGLVDGACEASLEVDSEFITNLH